MVPVKKNNKEQACAIRCMKKDKCHSSNCLDQMLARVGCPNIKINGKIAQLAGRYNAVTGINCFLCDERAEMSKGEAKIHIAARNKFA